MSVRDSLPCIVKSCLPDGNGGEQVLEYELQDELGTGGMGTVYRARHLNPPDWYVQKHGTAPRIVAIKYLHERVLVSSPDALGRFVREAQLLMEVRHRNIVRIYNLGVDQESMPFLAMELVENARTFATLRDVYLHRKQVSGRDSATGKLVGSLVPLSELIPLLRQVCEALREVHAKDIVHRDIKPDNILVAEGQAKLMDFGISKSLDQARNPALTAEGRVVGTPYYTSPEAACECRIDPRNGKIWYVGPWSDRWSLGVTIYEMMSGVLPFDAMQNELPQGGSGLATQQIQFQLASLVLGKVVADHVAPTPLAELLVDPNPYMLQLVEACMSKGPWDRPASSDVMLEMLDLAGAYEARHPALPSPNDIPTETELRKADDIGLAPTQLESVPPAKSATRSGFGDRVIRDSNVRDIEAPRSGDSAGTASTFPRIWIALPLLLASAIAGVLVWGKLGESDPALPPPSVAVPRQASATPVRAADSDQSSAKRSADPGPAPGTRSYTVYQSGLAAARSGDCRRATSEMQAVLAAFPAFPKPYRILGDCARKSGKPDEARDNYAKYLSFEGVEPLPPEALKLVR